MHDRRPFRRWRTACAFFDQSRFLPHADVIPRVWRAAAIGDDDILRKRDDTKRIAPRPDVRSRTADSPKKMP
jgi:hypothetical protein